MKQMIRTIVVMLTMLISTQAADAQTFSSMKEEQRNVELIKMARKLYQAEIFKDYYKKYGDNDKPSVTVKKIKDTKSEVTNGNDVGEIQYIVKLYSVPTQEMKSIPAVEVVISDKLGSPISSPSTPTRSTTRVGTLPKPSNSIRATGANE